MNIDKIMATKGGDQSKQQNAQMAMPMGMDGMPPGMFESEMIGAIKIKDGLFIGDELASTVGENLIDEDEERAFLSVILQTLKRD